ncbi:MAG: LemA family protein [Nitrospirae bacterium]|nr:LemA family protein [Nitrospirota bacterium]
MKLKNKPLILMLLIFALAAINISSAGIAVPDQPYNHVVDLAGVINGDAEANLNRYLLELEQKTTAQMVVLTIDSLESEPLEEFSMNIAHKKWRLGQKGKDNGILLLVAVQDRKYRFETGYGLEGILPDSLTGSIGRQYLVPYFRQGNYSAGIYTGALAVIDIIASSEGVEITGMSENGASRYDSIPTGRGPGARVRRQVGIFDVVLGAMFFLGIIYLLIKHPRLLLLFFAMNMMGGGRRSGWGGGNSGGGFGGGSFLKRRYDLIPNLVETVKGYASHERELFEHIADARTKYFQANSVKDKIQASNQLEGVLSRLLVLQEQYPQLKANESFLKLQDSLEGTENRISVERKRYNESVQALNTYRRTVFGRLFSALANVSASEYYEIPEAEKEAPKVKF